MSMKEVLKAELSKAEGMDQALDVLHSSFSSHFQQMIEKFRNPDIEMTFLDRMKVFSQAVDFMDIAVESLELNDKDIIFFCGASRVGKGTLLEALGGTQMQLQETCDDGPELGEERIVMRPVCDRNELSSKESGPAATIGHGCNSHTFHPKIIYDFSAVDAPVPLDELKGYVLVDMPGLFDTKGQELAMAIQSSMYKMAQRAKSTRCMVLLAAGMFQGDNQKMINVVKQTLTQIFKNPGQALIVGITKLHRDCHRFRLSEEGIIDRIAGKTDCHVSLSEYDRIIPVKPDDPANIHMIAQRLASSQSVNLSIREGCIDPAEFKRLISPNSEEEREKDIQYLIAELRSLQPPYKKPQCNGKPPETFTEEVYMSMVDHVIETLKAQRAYWERVADFDKTPSLKGLVPSHMIYNELLKQRNPVIKAVIYQDESELAMHLYKDMLVCVSDSIDVLKANDPTKSKLSVPKKNAILKTLGEHESRLEKEFSKRLGWDRNTFFDYAARQKAQALAVGGTLGVSGAALAITTLTLASQIGVPFAVIAEGLLAVGVLSGPIGWIFGASAAAGYAAYAVWNKAKYQSEEEEEKAMEAKMGFLFEHCWATVDAFHNRCSQCKHHADMAMNLAVTSFHT